MTSDRGNSDDDNRPDLAKQPDTTETAPGHTPPVNPYPEQPTYPSSPPDQFMPYTPPQYGDPLQTQYPTQQYPTPQYPEPQYPAPFQYPVPQYPVPGFPMSAGVAVRPRPAAVTATRVLGACALVGALLVIAYGWLAWASFEPKYTKAPKVSVNGWGQVFQNGLEVTMDPGTAGTPFAAFFIPFFVLPVAILAVLVMCNIARVGNSIAILVLTVLHLFVALAFLAVPSTCIIFDYEDDAALFEGLNNFSTGPGTILTTLTMVIVMGTSIAGIVLGRRKIYSPPPAAGGYPDF